MRLSPYVAVVLFGMATTACEEAKPKPAEPPPAASLPAPSTSPPAALMSAPSQAAAKNDGADAAGSAPSPAPQPVAPAVAKDDPKPDPPVPAACVKACKEAGLCASPSGDGCFATKDDHCRKSDRCRTNGNCAAVDYDDGKWSETCRHDTCMCAPRTDADCEQSERCKSDGACKNIDFSCQNPSDPKFLAERKRVVKDAQRMLNKLANACNADKNDLLGAFRRGGPELHFILNPAWVGRGGRGLVRLDLAMEIKSRIEGIEKAWDAVESTWRSNKARLGDACFKALDEGFQRGREECLKSPDNHDVKWAKKVGVEECK